MTTDEIKQLADTLMKGGLVTSQTEALRKAEEMVSTSDKVLEQQNITKEEQAVQEKIPSITQEVEEVPEPVVEAVPEPVAPVQEPEPVIPEHVQEDPNKNWSEEATNKITSNNDIMKTLQEIGKDQSKDPNDSLNGAVSDPANYSKIENLHTPSQKETNWLPTTPREPVKEPEPVQTAPPVVEPVAQEQPKEVSPENYTANRMSGSLNDMVQKHSEPEPVKEEVPVEAPVAQEPVQEEPVQQPVAEPAPQVEAQTNEYFNKPETQEPLTEPVQEQAQPESVSVQETAPIQEQAPVEQPQEEPKKRNGFTPEEEELRKKVDLSKVFNFNK